MSGTGFAPAVRATIEGRSMGLCEVCGGGLVVEHHHRRPRGAGGSKRLDTNQAANGLGLCYACHRLIESNRRLAMLLGWLLLQSDQPNARPVMYRGAWVYLLDDGTITTVKQSEAR
jgi:5-methylcytosine-specific restriction protein A